MAKSGGAPAAPVAPPAPIESLGAADKELKKIKAGRETALSEFQARLFGKSSSKGRTQSGPRGSTSNVGGFKTPDNFAGLNIDQQAAKVDALRGGNAPSRYVPYGGTNSGGSSPSFTQQLATIRGADGARESQLNQFIAAEMKVLDKDRRRAGRGRTGNIHAGKRKADPKLSDASTLDKTSRTLV